MPSSIIAFSAGQNLFFKYKFLYPTFGVAVSKKFAILSVHDPEGDPNGIFSFGLIGVIIPSSAPENIPIYFSVDVKEEICRCEEHLKSARRNLLGNSLCHIRYRDVDRPPFLGKILI